MATLTVFDLDDTLFYCKAQAYVIRADGTREQVSSSLTADLQPGDVMDYSMFRSSQFFYDTAKPIDRMVKKFKNIRRNTRNPESRIIILTARADFDNKDLFLAALDYHGVYYDDVFVHRAGNLTEIPDTPSRKLHVIKDYLDEGTFSKVRMFDDCTKNLDALLAMPEHLAVKRETYLVFKDGTVEPYFR